MQMCVPVHAHVDWNTSSLGGLDYFFMNSEKGLKPGDFGLNNFSVCEQNGQQCTSTVGQIHWMIHGRVRQSSVSLAAFEIFNSSETCSASLETSQRCFFQTQTPICYLAVDPNYHLILSKYPINN